MNKIFKFILGPFADFTTPKKYRKKTEAGIEEIKKIIAKGEEAENNGEKEETLKLYKRAVDELNEHIFRENLPLMDIGKASLAICLFMLPINFFGPWWYVAGVAGVITYIMVSTYNVRKEVKPKFEILRETTVQKYNSLITESNGKLVMLPDKKTRKYRKKKKEKTKS